MVQENDAVLCTVDKIEGTTVFVTLDSGEKGTISISEIAPGRIRNIRDYVVPNKKIVCKVLRVFGDHINLSLRRVSGKERDEIMNAWKAEVTIKSAFKKILGETAEKVEEKILKEFPSLPEFVEKTRENSALIEKYIPKEYHDAVKTLTEKKKKEIEVRKILELKCFDKEDGIVRIKKILIANKQKSEISYLGAGRFLVIIKSDDYKKANHLLDSIIQKMEQDSKKEHCEFTLEQK